MSRGEVSGALPFRSECFSQVGFERGFERDMDICRPKDHKRWSRPTFVVLWPASTIVCGALGGIYPYPSQYVGRDHCLWCFGRHISISLSGFFFPVPRSFTNLGRWKTSEHFTFTEPQAQGIQNERLCLPSKRTFCSPTYYPMMI